MSENRKTNPFAPFLSALGRALGMPALALLTAFIIGAIVILLTSGDLLAAPTAYWGLIRGALFKQRGLSESLVASIPYVLLSLGLSVGFKSGLFNIGVEGQFYIGALCAAWAGQITTGLPAIIHLPLALLAGAIGGAIWAGVPGYLKMRTGAHEVISTMMMNYVAFRLTEYVITDKLRDVNSTTIQTPSVSPAAELWTFAAIPQRLQDPLNALGVALVLALLTALVVRALADRPDWKAKLGARRGLAIGGSGLLAGLIAFVALPLLTNAWWPFTDAYDRLHTGLIMAVLAAVGVWWLMEKTTPRL